MYSSVFSWFCSWFDEEAASRFPRPLRSLLLSISTSDALDLGQMNSYSDIVLHGDLPILRRIMMWHLLYSLLINSRNECNVFILPIMFLV